MTLGTDLSIHTWHSCKILIFYLSLNILLLPKDQPFIFFAVTAVGVVPCGGPKNSPRTSSIVQVIFLFRSFETSKDIQSVPSGKHVREMYTPVNPTFI